MRTCCIHSIIAVALSIVCGATLAHALKIDPGNWEFTSTSSNSMSPQKQVETSSECIAEAELSAEEFLEGMDGCTVSDVQSTDTNMSWSVSCAQGPSQMTGDAKIQSAGSTVNGNMTMQMSLGAQTMSMHVDWKGRRLGDCE